MSVPEENTRKIINKNLTGSKFDGGLIDATAISAGQIGNNTTFINLNLNDPSQLQQMLESMLARILEKSTSISKQQKEEMLEFFSAKDAPFSKAKEFQIQNINDSETINAHYKIAKYLEPVRIRCNLTLVAVSETLKLIDLSNFYYDEDLYEAAKTLCDLLFICISWLSESVKWFAALPLMDKDKTNLKTCEQELIECAFNIIKKDAETWTNNAEVAKEVGTYLNLLLQQIYS